MKRFSKIAIVLILGLSLGLSGCSTAWVTTFDNILVAAAPALVNILNIVAIAEGKPVDAALVTKVNADAANLKTLASDFANASAAAAPGACSQLQAAINTYSADEAAVLQIAQVSNPATQQKVATLSALVAGTVSAILAVIPSCSAPPAALKAEFAGKGVPLPLSSFVSSYNSVLVQKTGDANVDAYTAKHKIHVHSKFMRVITIGKLQ